MQVPLGVQLRNENKLDEMVEIIDVLHKYVPFNRSSEAFETIGHSCSQEVINIDLWHFKHIMLGGDQLTSDRVCGSHRARCNSDSARHRLEEIIPVIEDWHTMMTAM